MEIIIVLLISFILIREIFYFYQIQKLVNKIMSKNYYDYEFSKKISKKPDIVKNEQEIRFENDDSDIEELNQLMGMR